MNTIDIFINLKSLILKKGLTTYLLSWGYAPQTITKEAILSADFRNAIKPPILICDEDLLKSGIRSLSNFRTLIFKSPVASISNAQAIEIGVKGICDFNVSPGHFNQGLRAIIQGNTFFPPSDQNNNNSNNARPLQSELTVLSDLTRREREVLRHIANEYTNKEIAEILFISPRTVETHRRNLIQKLKVKNSVGLVKIYLESRSIA